MSRKSRKGYFVKGTFVVAGSDADEQARNSLRNTAQPSRTELKNASTKLQEVGAQLLSLRAGLLASLSLPEPLHDAIEDASLITSFGAKRRQMQLIGRLMHSLDPETLEAVTEALRVHNQQSTKHAQALHRAEHWRSSLIADDDQLKQWIDEFPETDAQHLRALIRQARKDAEESARETVNDDPVSERGRRGRAFRQIFALVRAQLKSANNT
jgi:ribosome-associated protein